MKKLIFIPVIMMAFFASVSCERDDSLTPTPLTIPGEYVRLDITSKRLNFDDITNTYFGGELTAPGQNVAKYNLYVRKTDILGFASEFVFLKEVTSFPYQLKVTPEDIAGALQVPVSSLVFGDTFRFYGESFNAAGKRTDYYSLSTVVQSTSSMKQAYRFVSDMTNNDGYTEAELAVYDNYTSQ